MIKTDVFLYLKYTLIGACTGLANGIFGSGGGMIAVPALYILLNMDEHRSHATAISIILPLTVVSTFVYMGNGHIEMDVAFRVIPGGIVGGYAGARLLKKCPDGLLRKIFGIFIIAGGIKMIIG